MPYCAAIDKSKFVQALYTCRILYGKYRLLVKVKLFPNNFFLLTSVSLVLNHHFRRKMSNIFVVIFCSHKSTQRFWRLRNLTKGTVVPYKIFKSTNLPYMSGTTKLLPNLQKVSIDKVVYFKEHNYVFKFLCSHFYKTQTCLNLGICLRRASYYFFCTDS